MQSTGTTFEEKYAREIAEGLTMVDIISRAGEGVERLHECALRHREEGPSC
jgi:hypothetical protein